MGASVTEAEDRRRVGDSRQDETRDRHYRSLASSGLTVMFGLHG